MIIALATGVVSWGAMRVEDRGDQRALASRMEQLHRGTAMMARLFAETASRVAAATGTGDNRRVIDTGRAALLVARLGEPAVRVRLFDYNGRLVADSELRDEPPPAAEDLTPLQQAYEDFARWLRAGTGLTDASGVPLIIHLPEAREALQGTAGERVEPGEDGRTLLSVAAPVLDASRVMGALVVSTVVRPDPAARWRPAERIGLAAVLALSVLVLGGFLLTWPLERGVRLLAASAERALRRGAVAVASEAGPGRVLEPLSGVINRLSGRLQAQIEEAELYAREVAHEVKNPLSSLRSAVETAAHISDPHQHKRLMEVIVQDVARLDRLISTITDLSQVDAELAAIPDDEVDLEAMLDALVEIENAASAQEWDPTFVLLSGGGPFRVRGAEARLAQVFRNLMSNARSFSPPGGTIRMTATRKGAVITLTCDDDGPGLSPGKEEAIFQRFYSDRPDHQPYAGHSGLGLSLCRQIVRAHGGTIWAENRLDPIGQVIGARFTVVLPSA
ncbi:MAG: histidine kinase [Alphaproteobacteria bacterium]|nr:histidine kinase [Alphaproteobacteria bacterium]MCB9931170.1 histidine kinase [Alphaproteobacteria bacterium]